MASSPDPVGRNEPCPCNSGKKYKHCCYGEANTSTPSDYDRAMKLHDLDRGVVEQVMKFARSLFGKGWLDELLGEVDMILNETTAGYLVISAVYFWMGDGATPVEHFLASPASRRLTAREREWIVAQQRSWLSLWEVVEVARGFGFTVRDLITGEVRKVTERSATQDVTLHDGFLARIVDFEGLSVLGGLHPRILPPRPLEALVKKIRKSARLGTNGVTVDVLRKAVSFEDWCNFWQRAVDEHDRVASTLPQLQNTDGDPLLLTKDHFAFEAANRGQIEELLARLADDEGNENPREKVYTFLREGNAMHKDWDNTVVGKAVLRQCELTIETNSIRRADELRSSVEKALGDLISLREFKNEHYRQWLDTPLPGLSNLTPRQAVKKPRKRADLILMLKEMENMESRLPEAERFDMAAFWQELGLRDTHA
jgi:hypothetical protein